MLLVLTKWQNTCSFFLNPISFLVAFWQLVYIFELVPSAEWVIVQLVCAYHCVPLWMLLSEFVWEYKLNWFRSEINRRDTVMGYRLLPMINEIKAEVCSRKWESPVQCGPVIQLLSASFFSCIFLQQFLSFELRDFVCVINIPVKQPHPTPPKNVLSETCFVFFFPNQHISKLQV